MKKILFIILLLSALQTKAQVYYKSGTFKIVNATKVVIYPGVMGSPISTLVSFQLILKTCTRIDMDSFWMDGYSDKVLVFYKNGDTWDGKPLKGDTLNIVLEYFKTTADESPETKEFEFNGSPKSEPPAQHKGKALFRYKLAGKSYFFSITKIEEKPSVYAP